MDMNIYRFISHFNVSSEICSLSRNQTTFALNGVLLIINRIKIILNLSFSSHNYFSQNDSKNGDKKIFINYFKKCLPGELTSCRGIKEIVILSVLRERLSNFFDRKIVLRPSVIPSSRP